MDPWVLCNVAPSPGKELQMSTDGHRCGGFLEMKNTLAKGMEWAKNRRLWGGIIAEHWSIHS